MCFRFDGENAVTTCRPETCRERLRAAGARNPMPTATGGEPGRLAVADFGEATDVEPGRHIAAASVPMY